MFVEKLSYLEEVKPLSGSGWYYVSADKIAEVCLAAKSDGFDCLSCLTGTDRGDHIEVVYHLFSYAKKETVVLKAKVQGSMFNVPSVSNIYPSANWMERETFDLLGVSFAGHPDLRKILMPEDWVGHPLRKDYKEPSEYCGMLTTR